MQNKGNTIAALFIYCCFSVLVCSLMFTRLTGNTRSLTLYDPWAAASRVSNIISNDLEKRPPPQAQKLAAYLRTPTRDECTHRPQWLQDKVDQRRARGKTLIYYHEGPSAGRHASFYEWFFPNNATYSCYEDCESTMDPLRAPEADVVVVLYRKKIEYYKSNRHRVPLKYCGQLFVMVQAECANNIDPYNTPRQKYEDSKIFDISSTFRLDSDLPRPYTPTVDWFLQLAKQNFVPVDERDSDSPVAWVASRCNTFNERISYVEELMTHIGVKSYGTCLHNADMDVSRKDDNWLEGADATIGRAKFYLAFENSNCDYYVTEKLYRTMKNGVIPVIMGAPQAHLYMPNNHSAIYVRDYDSPAALAKKLHEINNNDELFKHYTSYIHDPDEIDEEFRDRWMGEPTPYACELCDLVKDAVGKDNTNFKGVPYEHWESCEQVHGTWETNFQPLDTPDGIVPKSRKYDH